MAQGKFQKKKQGNPVAMAVGICAVIVLVCLVGTIYLLNAREPHEDPTVQPPGTSQSATIPANTTQPLQTLPDPTQASTTPTEATTSPTEETTEPTEAVTEPTEAETAPDEELLTFGEAVAATARAQEGKPYQHGGQGPDAFDTSGLVYYCLKENGVTSSRLVSGLAAGGSPVEKDQLLPGDVVFFWTENEGEAEYVGIYLGEGKFIAARHGDNPATIMDLTTNYFSQRFVCARRYEPENKD